MNGFLAPDGTFYRCNYGEHHLIAYEIVENNSFYVKKYNNIKENVLMQYGFIYFGSDPQEIDSFVTLDFDNMIITDEQVFWIKSNKTNITNSQWNYIENYLKIINKRK